MKNIGKALWRRALGAAREVITWLNGLGSLVALYALQYPVVSDKMLGFVPEGWRPAVAVLLPLGWFWLVQKGKEIDKARSAAPPRPSARTNIGADR